MSIKIIKSLRTLCLTLAFIISSPLFPWYFKYSPHTTTTAHAAAQKPLCMTILLVPAGDAHNQGRSLEHQFESSSSMAYAFDL
jgi:hypothetical protein